MSVIIPIRNEARHVRATLQALYHQTDELGRELDRSRYEVLVLANNCRDESAALVRAFARQHPDLALHLIEQELPPAHAHVGYARRLLMDEAARRLRYIGQPRGIIASTDGDTRVAPTWIAAIQREVARGADAVGGRILVGNATGPGRRYHLLDVGYRMLINQLEAHLDPDPADPFPRHYQMFGASLAVTAEMYERAGGLPALPSLEDVALYRALERMDARIRRSPSVRVYTSGRAQGRTAWGMAAQLRMWETMEHGHVPFLVESGLGAVARFRAKRMLRQVWQYRQQTGLVAPAIKSLAHVLNMPSEYLTELVTIPQPFGALWELIRQYLDQPEGAWPQRWPLTDIHTAIRELRRILHALPVRPFEQIEPVGSLALTEPVL